MRKNKLETKGFEKCASCGKLKKVYFYVTGRPYCSRECACEAINAFNESLNDDEM